MRKYVMLPRRRRSKPLDIVADTLAERERVFATLRDYHAQEAIKHAKKEAKRQAKEKKRKIDNLEFD